MTEPPASTEPAPSRLATPTGPPPELLDAMLAVGSGLELRPTLERFVAAACGLTNARYGALAVLGEHGLAEFISHGLTDQDRASIGIHPAGKGLLGLLIDDPQPIRLADLTQHPQSHGFPPGHPPMRAFLGVPITLRDRVFGNLYLADKRDGEFTGLDEKLIIALAAAAAVAIENAELYAQAHRRQRWLEAAAEITGALLGQVTRTSALRLVAQRAREVSRAGTVLILLHNAEFEQVTVEVADGAVDPAIVGVRLPDEEVSVGDVLRGRSHVLVEDLGQIADWPIPVRTGAALLVPLASGGNVVGVLAVAEPVDGPHGVSIGDIELVESFAAQAALALERARAQEERELLAVLSDRERIARDLHDVVIQRLFAIGLQLQSTARMAPRPELADRVNAAVDELDATIRDIRGAIFELRHPADGGLRGAIRELIAEAAAGLGFTPRLRLDGAVESAVPHEVQPDLLAALREMLSNAVRHAHATSVEVTVIATGSQLSLRVVDDGLGISVTAVHSGLNNLRERATVWGGRFEVGPNTPRGTLAAWTVPL